MPRIVHFEIPAETPSRAIDFYQTVFDWKFTKWEGPMEYYLIDTNDSSGPTLGGGLMLRNDPAQPVVNTIEVNDIDAYSERIVAAGGQVVVPKFEIPGVGWLSYFKDTEGNIFGFMQPFPKS